MRIFAVFVFLLATSVQASARAPVKTPRAGRHRNRHARRRRVPHRHSAKLESRSRRVLPRLCGRSGHVRERRAHLADVRRHAARGFAVIQSAYSATGWAVEEGVADTERLRKHFVATHGAPKETFASGMSMGGTLTVIRGRDAAGGLRRRIVAVRRDRTDRPAHAARFRAARGVRLLLSQRARCAGAGVCRLHSRWRSREENRGRDESESGRRAFAARGLWRRRSRHAARRDRRHHLRHQGNAAAHARQSVRQRGFPATRDQATISR